MTLLYSSLKTSLTAAQQKLKVLERRLDQVLAEKNAKIRTLEARLKSSESLSKVSCMHSLSLTLLMLIYLLRMTLSKDSRLLY